MFITSLNINESSSKTKWTDTPDTLNYSFMKKVVELLGEVILEELRT